MGEGSVESGDSPKKITLADIQNPEANQEGEYFMHLNTARDLLNLAVERSILQPAEADVMVHDLRNARNASEVLEAQRPLTRRLYQEAVDYSDILHRHGAIDYGNYTELKSNIQRGKEFTSRDLEDADHLDSIAARAAAGLESPKSANNEISEGLDRMQLRKKIHPEKGPDEE